MTTQRVDLNPIRLLRPSWAEIDHDAIGKNVESARRLLGSEKKIYFVCKGDGFGFGAALVARLAAKAGIDGFCVGSPEEAQSIRDAGINHDILLFASTLPADAAEIVKLKVIVTIHSLESLDGFLALRSPVQAFMEIDAGFGRFGLTHEQWPIALERIRRQSLLRLRGIYSHLSAPEDQTITQKQTRVFESALHDAEKSDFRDLEQILASSRVMLLHPRLSYTGVDPGRFIYGALDQELMKQGKLYPLLKAVRGKVIHIQNHPAGTELGLGYGAPIQLSAPIRLATVPIGFWDGLNHKPPLGEVIVNGRRAPVMGRRSFQHSVIDISAIPDATIGSVVTFLGVDGNQAITFDELAAWLQIPVMELVPRLARSLPHVAHDTGPIAR